MWRCWRRSLSGELALQCDTCKVHATSEKQLAIHLVGKKHKRHLAIAELEQAGPLSAASAEGRSEEELRCDMCDVTAPSAQHHEFHIRHGNFSMRRQNLAIAYRARESVSAVEGSSNSDGSAYIWELPCTAAPWGFADLRVATGGRSTRGGRSSTS